MLRRCGPANHAPGAPNLAGGDGPPHSRADAPTGRAAVALAAVLPQPAQRTVLRHFAELLDNEWRLYKRDEERRSSVAPEDMTAAAFDVVRELCFATVRAVGNAPDGHSVEPVAGVGGGFQATPAVGSIAIMPAGIGIINCYFVV